MQTDKIVNHIIDWLREYLNTSRQKGFVLGISGGIDSAVVSTLCAMTGFPTLCMELPIHQKSDEVSRARNHISWLQSKFGNVISDKIDLTTTFDEFKSTVAVSEDQAKTDLALANTRSRLRMVTLYYYAGINHYIVAGTGNKVEDFGVGFFTKYGDGGVDISPIGDLMKSEVYQIAAYLGINIDIQKAVPTDGLFDNSQSDEEQIGASYPELEWAMHKYEEGSTVEEFYGRQKEVFKIYTSRHRANLHKMIPIPICEIPMDWKVNS
jgi:NAD+ synthase